MSNLNPLVRINIDPVEDIEQLYGIGRKLAERVVSYRQTQHYFQTPEDLAKVDGLSLQLAVTISPHIDWQLPIEQVSSQEHNWIGVVILIMSLIALNFTFSNEMLPD